MDDPAETPRPRALWEKALGVLLTGDTRLAEALVGIEYALVGAGTWAAGAPTWPELDRSTVTAWAAAAGAYGVAQTFAALVCNRSARRAMHYAGAFIGLAAMLLAASSHNVPSAIVNGALGVFCLFLAARVHWDAAREAAGPGG